MNKQLEVKNVSVAYAEDNVVRDVSFGLERGELSCLLGPSGCGKSTLLRAIAGFEAVSAGQIMINGRQVSNINHSKPPEQRRVGMVFQDFALFPHLTVGQNIAFGLRRQSKPVQQSRVKQLLQLMDLPGMGKYYPHQISGGQQQRIALARALAPRPDILLLDEPFSSMDVELREQLVLEVRDMLRKEEVTAILVTHDQNEAFVLAEKIGVLYAGRLLQWDSGYHLYHAPQHRFVAEFIGQGVLLPGSVVTASKVSTDLGIFSGDIPPYCTPGCPVQVLLRPDDIVYDEHSRVKGVILEKRFRGAEYLYTLRLESGAEVLCMVASHHRHEPGEHIGIHLDVEHLVVFPVKENDGKR